MYDAISYKRFSSPKQSEGDSDRRQTDLTREYCERRDLTLIDTYLDAGVSGFTGRHLTDRGALRALLDAASEGKFRRGTHLIVESLDRLTRQEVSAAVRLFLDILDTGLVIVTLIDGEQVFTKERVDSDLTAIIIAVVFLSRANNESRVKRERGLHIQQMARKRAREQKIPMPVRAPSWLKVVGEGDNRHFVVDPERAQVVRQIFTLSARGKSQLRITRFLNESQVPTFGGKSKWAQSSIHHVLRSPSVYGSFHPRTTVFENGALRLVRDPAGPVEDYFPAIVTKALYDRSRAELTLRNRRPTVDGFPPRNNLVSRLGCCLLCGSDLFFSQTTDGFAYLRCVNVRLRECENRLGYPYRKLESVLLALDDLTRLIAEVTAAAAVANRRAKRNSSESGARIGLGPDQSHVAKFVTRFATAKAMAQSPDITQRREGRYALVKEFHALFKGVVLHPNRIVTLHLRRDIHQFRAIITLGPDGGLQGIQVEAPGGITGFVDPSLTSGLVKPTPSGSRSRAPDRGGWRSSSVSAVLRRTRIVYSQSGDWQAVAHDASHISELVARAEEALAGRGFRESL
jgi:DNA invertase Pin-like site-specific DNA recombinase